MHCLAVPSSDPLKILRPSRLHQTDATSFVCPGHFVMTLHVSMSHNLTAPSELPLTNFFPYGDNAMVHTQLSPFRQSFLICFPLSKFHIRSVPSNEQVIIRCPSGRCMVVQIELVCPSNFWRGVIPGVSFVLVLGEAMLQNLKRTTTAGGQQGTMTMDVSSYSSTACTRHRLCN